MTRIVLALLALALPALAGAEDIYRWRNANGVLNYSNQAAHVPSDAVVLQNRIEIVHEPPAAAPAPRPADRFGVAPATPRRQEI